MHARNLGVVFGRELSSFFITFVPKMTLVFVATLMRSRDPNAEFSDMAGKALSVEWLVENAPIVFEQSSASP